MCINDNLTFEGYFIGRQDQNNMKNIVVEKFNKKIKQKAVAGFETVHGENTFK